MPKAQLSLEYIIKVVILLVVLAVVISLMMKFSDDIKRWVREIFDRLFGNNTELDFPKRITGSRFTSDEVSNYIESCYATLSGLPEAEQRDIDCYILIVEDSFDADANSVLNNLPSEIASKTQINTDFSRSLVIIQFQDIGNKIVVTDK